MGNSPAYHQWKNQCVSHLCQHNNAKWHCYIGVNVVDLLRRTVRNKTKRREFKTWFEPQTSQSTDSEQTVGVTCFRVIAIKIAFVTPDQQIVSFSLSPLHFPKAVWMYYEMSMNYLIVILTVCFPISQINNNNNKKRLFNVDPVIINTMNSFPLNISIVPPDQLLVAGIDQEKYNELIWQG